MEAQHDIQRADRNQQAEIAAFLRSILGEGLAAALYAPEFLHWKYFAGRSDHPASRSYVLASGGAVQAHVCVWPVRFQTASRQVRSCHLIDWAARRDAQGAGVRIYQHLMAQHETVIAVGGSPVARKILPRLGFRPQGAVDVFIRVIRPWRQYRTRPQQHQGVWRDVARFGRNLLWSFGPSLQAHSEWSAVAVADPEALPAAVFCFSTSRFCSAVRSVAGLRYLLECPVMNCHLFAIHRAGQPRGYFLLNQKGGQCRIIDLAIDSDEIGDWEQAYRVALTIGAGLAETCEMAVYCSMPELCAVLRQLGLRSRQKIPIMLYDPGGLLRNAGPLHVSMTDSDACFLYSEKYPFDT